MNILIPTVDNKGNYLWEGLEAKQSLHGKGVFATKNLKKFTCIPILGQVLKSKTDALKQQVSLLEDARPWQKRNFGGRAPSGK